MFDVPLLDKAHEITSGDRQDSYGHPLVNFLREALMFSILENRVVTPIDIVRGYYIKKICRESNCFKDDNHLDMAGYAAALDACDRMMRKLGYQSGVKNFERMGDWLPSIHFMASLYETVQEVLAADSRPSKDYYSYNVQEAAAVGLYPVDEGIHPVDEGR